MKKLVLVISLLSSGSLWAAQCQTVDVKNELRLSRGSDVEIHTANGATALLDHDNNLYLSGQKQALNSEQQDALESYRESIADALPKARQVAQDGVAMANDILDDVADSIDAPQAFDKVKQSLQQFVTDIEARYQKEGDWVLPADTFESMSQQWQQDFDKARALFTQEFLSGAFDAIAAKMNQDGGINLTELGNTMAQLRSRLEQRFSEHSQTIEEERQELCDSLDEMVQQEQQLHKKIPELKNYQVFTI
ncbi:MULTISPECIES: DUF2884 family protein [Vibrio]|uniref:YggN family protein n=1 Tax=Vibrio ostreae TaxID=2841925 RepID=A0A975YPW4_9VIBR|nr:MULTISPECIES: DUF2884 family protein [Vibrio]QXO19262.1 YggN family protein [Vibrio ostreae]WGY48655.1 YggN family protein [Vibrio sp. ABG19]